MTFFTLLLFLTQAVSIGVVDKPMALANGTKLMPGDRVLAIHDSTHRWLAFLPSGEFDSADSSKIMIAGEWHPSNLDLGKWSDAESGAWSEPDRQSKRVPWRTPRERRLYFDPNRPAGFSYRDSSFWGRLLPGSADGWFPLKREQVLASISVADSSGARELLDMVDALNLGRTSGRFWESDTTRSNTVARLYELSFEANRRQGHRELAANALLTLVGFDIGRSADSAALARLRRAASEFVGVKSIYGRADVYAYWQMMELAWRHKDTDQTRKLARKMITGYPMEAAEARVRTGVGIGPSLVYATGSLWFDVKAAERLLQAAGGDDSQMRAAAEFLTESASLAVRYQGYRSLVALSNKRADTTAALSYARTALALPHYSQLEVWPPSGCCDPGGSRNHDFKNEFMDSLDVLLPIADLLPLYDSAYNSKDTMMSKDAANWYMRQIERGRTPPRAGILDRIDPPRNSAELKRDLLASMTDAPQYRTALECSLFTHRPDDYPNVDRMFTQTLPRGSLVQPYVMREGLVRVATRDGNSGWTYVRSLRGALRVWNISADELVTASAVEPLTNADLNGDGARDLGLSTMDVLDGKALAPVRPTARKGAWVTGFYRGKWVELRGDTLWLRGIGTDTIGKAVPISRRTKKGVCRPGNCFYFVAMPGPGDSLAWVSAVGEHGTLWTTPISVRKVGADAIYQVDSTLIITGGDSARLLSAVDGAMHGRIAINRGWKSWLGVFFNRSGYAVAKGDSVIYKAYSGSRELRVAVGKSDAKLIPPFAASFESDIWGVGRFGRPLCPVSAEAIPVVSLVHRYDGERWRYDIALHLISLTDGRELATVAMSENYYDCRYDEHGVYVSDDTSFRAITWEGKPLKVADLPLLSYPIWDGNRVVSYYSEPMGLMLSASAASNLAAAVRPLKSRWPAMGDPREYGE